MGASKRLYFLTTQPISESEFWDFYKTHQDIIQDNWKVDENDRELFVGDVEYKTLVKNKLDANKKLQEYKEMKRKSFITKNK